MQTTQHRLILPKDKEALASIIDHHAEREEARMLVRRTMWLFSTWYLNGYRRFTTFNPEDGALHAEYLDEEGKMEYQSQDLLTSINRVAGRIQGADLRPKVVQQGMSIGGLRDRSVAQVLMDSMISEDSLEKVKEVFAFYFTAFGMAGLGANVVDNPAVGLTADLEVIHPQELFPFPSLGNDLTQVRGVMRQRWIPITMLEDRYGKKKVSSLIDEMDAVDVNTGDTADLPTGTTGQVDYMSGPNVSGGASGTNEPGKHYTRYVKIRELWLTGERNVCYRNVVSSGDAVLEDNDWEGREVYCPVGYARFFNTGSWTGAGVFDVLFSLSRHKEKLLKSLFNNAKDLDRFGFLVMPQGQMNERSSLREVAGNLRVLSWEPDPMTEGFRPFAFQPTTTGDFPGRVASFANEEYSRISPLRDLIEEKGRVDSATGLAILDEQIQESLSVPTSSLNLAWSNVYRAVAHMGVSMSLLSNRSIPVNRMTLDLAGAVIDPENNTVSFARNPVPSLAQLRFVVQNVSPRSQAALREDLLRMYSPDLQLFAGDTEGFIIKALSEGIDITAYLDDYAGAYESIVRDILLLYADGQYPENRVKVSPFTAKPAFQLRILTNFLATPTAKMAFPDVKNALFSYASLLRQYMGMVLPYGTPNADDMAMLTQGQGMAQLQPQPLLEG